MKRGAHSVFLLLVIFLFQSGYGQQDPQYTQYRYNLSVVNPAYAGSQGLLSVRALYRRQWSGFEGAPETFTFSAHTPVNEKVGLGLSVIKDALGPVEETNVYADFSYTIQISRDQFLAFGLKAGMSFHSVGLTSLVLQDEADPFFSQNISNNYINIGAGAFTYTDDYFIGLSVPNMLNAVHLDANGLKYGNEVNHFFLVGGYVFDVSKNENILLRPSTLLKGAIKAPFSFDVNMNALFYNKVEAGISYRLNDSFSGLVGFQVTPQIRIGYAYDNIVSDLKLAAGASHEVIVTFDIIFREGRGVPLRFL